MQFAYMCVSFFTDGKIDNWLFPDKTTTPVAVRSCYTLFCKRRLTVQSGQTDKYTGD